MNNITLHLSGEFCIFRYSEDFRRLYFYSRESGFIPFSRTAQLPLRCGQMLKKSDVVLTIKHKLGIV
jgi:hypothetical protein